MLSCAVCNKDKVSATLWRLNEVLKCEACVLWCRVLMMVAHAGFRFNESAPNSAPVEHYSVMLGKLQVLNQFHHQDIKYSRLGEPF